MVYFSFIGFWLVMLLLILYDFSHSGLQGGGKRAHSDVTIPLIMAKPTVRPSDCAAVVEAISVDSFNISSWLETLSSVELKDFIKQQTQLPTHSFPIQLQSTQLSGTGAYRRAC